MHDVGLWLFSLLLYSLLTLTKSDQAVYDSISCGTFLGDSRYCLDFSNADLTEPPVGWNITTILDLSANRIQKIDGSKFKDQLLLVELDLSNNEIKFIDVRALQNLRNLKELRLGNNDFACDNSICPFQSWLRANEHKVSDLDLVTCASPSEIRGRRVIDVDTSFLCRNVTSSYGFEINTGTVFMIWIVVPILITCVTALYIVVNGNNRVGRTVRSSVWACCRSVFPTGRPSSLAVWAATTEDREPAPPDFEVTSAVTSSGSLSRYLAPVESVPGDGLSAEVGVHAEVGTERDVRVDVIPGPSNGR